MTGGGGGGGGYGAILGGITAAIGLGVGLKGAHMAGRGAPLRNAGDELAALPYDQQREEAQAYVDAQMDNGQDFLGMVLGAYPQYNAAIQAAQRQQGNLLRSQATKFATTERALTTKQRAGDVSDLARYGGAMNDAFAAGSPGYAALLDEIGRVGGTTPLLERLNTDALGAGRSPIGLRLESDALRELDLGRGLSPEEERDAVQGARAAWSARGLGASSPAVGAEILARDRYAREREAGRRQYAAGVMGLLGDEDARNRSFATGVEQLNQGSDAARRSFTLAATEATTRPMYAMLGSRAVTPFNVATTSASMATRPGEVAGVMGAAPSIFDGSRALQPLLSYGADVANTNFNALEDRAIRKANAYLGLGSGLISTGGQMMAS